MIHPKTLRLGPNAPEADTPKGLRLREALAGRIDATQKRDRRAHPAYHYPRTAAEYWSVVDEWWGELVSIMNTYLPMSGQKWKDGDVLLNPATSLPETLAQHIERARLQRNRDVLLTVFNAAWGLAPDHGSIHATPGWEVLCDLCSESGVLYEDEMPVAPATNNAAADVAFDALLIDPDDISF